MSSSSTSWEEVRQRRMQAGYMIGSSTPVEGPSKKPRIISVSTIDSDSSSSIITRQPLKLRVKLEKKQEPAKAKKDEKPTEAKKEKKPAKAKENEKPAEAKKEKKPAKARKDKKSAEAKKEKKLVEKKMKARMNRKKTMSKKLVNSDNDWLTTAEQTDDEEENLEQSVRSQTKGLALFEDAASPELVRDPQAIHEYHFESPVRQLRKDASSPVILDLGDAEKSLPVEHLPYLRSAFENSDEEEELVLTRSDPVRTYPGVRHRRKKKTEICVDKSKRWLIDLKVPTAGADMLWDTYVKEHPEEMREWIAPPAERQKKSSSSSSSSSSNGYKGKATEKEDWRKKKISFGPDEPNKNMHIVRGHHDIMSRKWERHYVVKDPYEFPEPKDHEFENRSSGGSYLRWAGPSSSKNEGIAKKNVKKIKMKEKEKLQRSKPVEIALSKDFQKHNDLCSYAIRKNIVKDPYEFSRPKDFKLENRSLGDSDLHRAGPSCYKNEQITKENVENTKIKEEKEKLQRCKPMESASSKDFQRYSILCSYATRLKAKEQEMLSENVAESTNEKSLVPEKKFFKRKRAIVSNKDDSISAKKAVKSKPVIKSVRNLEGKRYIRENGHWRIV